tara:strand:+ start:785 stop:1168 length:384 start_codon:yes stop_codon:yes gene_type:complete
MASITTSEPIYFIHHLSSEEESDLNWDEFNEERVWDWSSPNHKPPFNTDYAELCVKDIDDENLRVAIGKKGCYLCNITEANNIAYIAHDRERQKFVIWGEHHKMNKVKNELIARINIAYEKIQNKYL